MKDMEKLIYNLFIAAQIISLVLLVIYAFIKK